MTLDPTRALQDALTAEHVAIWGYGVVGAHAIPERRATVQEVQDAHRTTRDQVADLLRSREADPVTASASYELPFAVTDPVSAITLGAILEDGVAAAWRYVLGETDDGAVRTTAMNALTTAAIQAVRWRQIAGVTPVSTAFPGQKA